MERLNDVTEFLLGLQDCIITFDAALASRGVLTREEIAGAAEETLEQQRSRPDAQHPARQMPVQALAKFFRMPTYDRLD